MAAENPMAFITFVTCYTLLEIRGQLVHLNRVDAPYIRNTSSALFSNHWFVMQGIERSRMIHGDGLC
jgi:hypothetical protein